MLDPRCPVPTHLATSDLIEGLLARARRHSPRRVLVLVRGRHEQRWIQSLLVQQGPVVGARVLLWAKAADYTADVYEGIGALALAVAAIEGPTTRRRNPSTTRQQQRQQRRVLSASKFTWPIMNIGQ